MTLWRGNCYAHVEFRARQPAANAPAFPDAKIVVHPESLREVRDLADAVCSTEKMITYCQSSPANQFVIVTESRHHPSAAEGVSGQRVYLRAGFRCVPLAHRRLPVQRVQNS